MTSDEIAAILPPIDIERGAEVQAKVTDAFGKLWEAGRLRALVDAPEGHVTVGFLQGTLAGFMQQYAAAIAEGQRDVMVADPDVMASVGGRNIDEADQAFIEPYVRHFEQIVSRA